MKQKVINTFSRTRKPICKTHKPINLPYITWCEWIKKKQKAGEKQTQCKECGRWLFKEEV